MSSDTQSRTRRAARQSVIVTWRNGASRSWPPRLGNWLETGLARIVRPGYSERMSSTTAALGLRLHTGWAVAVIAGGDYEKPAVLVRRRIELMPAGDSIPRFVFHSAAELPSEEAPTFVAAASSAIEQSATKAIVELVALKLGPFQVQSAAIASGSSAVPDDLSQILASHPLIHSAEAALFENIVARACASCGLHVVRFKGRELWHQTARTLGVDEATLREQIANYRQRAGSPWGADQKDAAAAAFLALRTDRPAGTSSVTRSVSTTGA